MNADTPRVLNPSESDVRAWIEGVRARRHHRALLARKEQLEREFARP